MTQNAAVDAAVSVIDYTIGENVDTLRRRAKLTTAALGREFQVSGPAMSLKLHGKRAWSAFDIQFAAQLFGVRMAQLVGEEPLPEPNSPATVTDFASVKRVTKQRHPNPNVGVLPVVHLNEWRRAS